jgi:hypothetical protein
MSNAYNKHGGSFVVGCQQQKIAAFLPAMAAIGS